jgi:hypothetical protein
MSLRLTPWLSELASTRPLAPEICTSPWIEEAETNSSPPLMRTSPLTVLAVIVALLPSTEISADMPWRSSGIHGGTVSL